MQRLWQIRDMDVQEVLEAMRQDFVSLEQSYGKVDGEMVRDILLDMWSSRKHWSNLFSAVTCLSCLCHRPSTLLRCGHRCCRRCIQFFGTRVDTEHNRYRLARCVLCGKPTEMPVVTLRPHFGRILEVDGGGVRGIVPLQFLQLLEDHMQVPGIFQHFFDYAIGTSSGKDRRCSPAPTQSGGQTSS